MSYFNLCQLSLLDTDEIHFATLDGEHISHNANLFSDFLKNKLNKVGLSKM